MGALSGLTKKKWIAVLGTALLTLALVVLMQRYLPVGFTEVERYFAPLPERTLQPDEKAQMKSVIELYTELNLSADQFPGWPMEKRTFWKYAIAFSSYGLPSAMLIDPDNKAEYAFLFSVMISKMKSRLVWGDYVEWGFGSDPISFQNIMYKGHLNLMFGLYQLSTGDQRYAREYTWLTKQISAEMHLRHQGNYEGTTCEPDHWFVECNMIGLLSLAIYDRLYGTSYRDNEIQWTLDFIKERIQDPDTGLFYRQYHPSHDVVDKRLFGYSNAWTIAFLNAFDPQEASRVYPSFKQHFIKEFGPYATVLGEINGEPDSVAHMFGLWVAKEMKDAALYNKLRNTTDQLGKLTRNSKTGGMEYDIENGMLLNGVALATKVHFDWNTILNHSWAYPMPDSIPDTSLMQWTDVLPTEVYRLDPEKELPKQRNGKTCLSCFWGDYQPPSIRDHKDELLPQVN